jgi:hypothetical protein
MRSQDMFTHRVTLNFKADAAPQLTRITECKIIPILRRQEGFSGEVSSITAVDDDRRETQNEAEAARGAGCQESLKSSVDVVVGLPMMGTFEAFNSTLHKVAA